MFDLRQEEWPTNPLAAAAHFHARHLPGILAALAGVDQAAAGSTAGGEGDRLTIVLPAADHAHRGWRLAAIRGLARVASPRRVNALVGTDEQALSEAESWLVDASGVTGQIFEVVGKAIEKA